MIIFAVDVGAPPTDALFGASSGASSTSEIAQDHARRRAVRADVVLTGRHDIDSISVGERAGQKLLRIAAERRRAARCLRTWRRCRPATSGTNWRSVTCCPCRSDRAVTLDVSGAALVIEPGTTARRGDRLRLQISAAGDRRAVGSRRNVARADQDVHEAGAMRDAVPVADDVDADKHGRQGARGRVAERDFEVAIWSQELPLCCYSTRLRM